MELPRYSVNGFMIYTVTPEPLHKLRIERIKVMNHAILVICHNNSKVVLKCLQALDDKRFSFYIMIDKKSKIENNDITTNIKYSRITFVKRASIN